jgi:membrane protein required for colicin V production
MDNILNFIKENIGLFDIIFLILVFYFSIQCFTKGFFLSLMSFLKWVLALIITIILVPRVEPYVANYIENKYVLGIGLGIFLYILTLFTLIFLYGTWTCGQNFWFFLWYI